ncbi:FHA domain-containing protein [Cryptosporidium andersoni]|uniref:FHA domain-containing protein n=1 Tax=Cryptosporidium andersoni TaxID=117008 RepID=A0A1J4MLE4_9CRYT|nr:FHA domain-containing protein [Cryptosporidium andersoni]
MPNEQNYNTTISFEPSGLLAMESNMCNGVFLKYSIPLDTCNSRYKWRLYVFNNINKYPVDNYPSTISIYEKQTYLIGSNERIADIEIKHPTICDQHAVIQHKYKNNCNPCIYVMDLDSKYGTYINDQKIESRRYYELYEKDSLKFGHFPNEYILLHDQSK